MSDKPTVLPYRDLIRAFIEEAGQNDGNRISLTFADRNNLADRIHGLLTSQSEGAAACERCGGKGWVDGHGSEENCKCGLVQAACPSCRPEAYCTSCGYEIVNELCHMNTHGHKPVYRSSETVQAQPQDDVIIALEDLAECLSLPQHDTIMRAVEELAVTRHRLRLSRDALSEATSQAKGPVTDEQVLRLRDWFRERGGEIYTDNLYREALKAAINGAAVEKPLNPEFYTPGGNKKQTAHD